MKQPVKNEIDILGFINKVQEQLTALEKKIDTLVHRSVPETKHSPAQQNERNKERVMHQAICADCKKECTIPFKPSGERPVYCQECFSRRKVISLSKIGLDLKAPVTTIQEPEVKAKKKTVGVKKTTGKKRPAPKKK